MSLEDFFFFATLYPDNITIHIDIVPLSKKKKKTVQDFQSIDKHFLCQSKGNTVIKLLHSKIYHYPVCKLQ